MARRSLDLDAFFSVDKPRGPTSHDVVARLRRASKIKRIGHAGTLDPLASGVLLVAVGRATRLIEYMAVADKAYLGEVTLGVETATYDAEGPPTATASIEGVTSKKIEQALDQFRGEITQRPPSYSAISVGGRRLHELARQGAPIEAPERQVTISTIELRAWEPPIAHLFMECSKGTYVRSIAHDLGRALGTGGHLSALVRTRVGPFTLESSVPLEALETAMRDGTWSLLAIAPEAAVAHLPEIRLASDAALKLAHGIAVLCPAEQGLEVGTLARATDTNARLVATVRVLHDGQNLVCRAEKVFATDTPGAGATNGERDAPA